MSDSNQFDQKTIKENGLSVSFGERDRNILELFCKIGLELQQENPNVKIGRAWLARALLIEGALAHEIDPQRLESLLNPIQLEKPKPQQKPAESPVSNKQEVARIGAALKAAALAAFDFPAEYTVAMDALAEAAREYGARPEFGRLNEIHKQISESIEKAGLVDLSEVW